MIKIENLDIGYETNILENTNLIIDKGKITFIIGKNGSGKSTLGNTLSGLKKFKKGNILLDNINLKKEKDIKKIRTKIGMVFQNPSNQILFTRVYDDIKFTLENINTPKDKIDSIIKESLDKVDMSDHINSNPYNLSGGEKQRIAIASILALKPDYIVFDEATSMLDINGKEDIYKLVNKLKKEGLGIIFITNIIDELIYADDIIILNDKTATKYSRKELFNNLNILKENDLNIPFTLKIIDLLKSKGISVNNKNDIIKEINNL
jgi:energy-coupling factor transport system ATP-binding protein